MHEIGRIINMKDGGPRGTIYQGDMTSHGGVVVGASGHMMKADGKLNARVGDMVTCPRCKPHLFPIATGDETVIDWDIAVPRDGDTIACGAVLISKTASASAIAAATAMQNIENFTYDEKVKLDHELISGVPYYIKVSDGRVYSGRIEDDKHLPRVATEKDDVYEVYFGDEALNKINGDRE